MTVKELMKELSNYGYLHANQHDEVLFDDPLLGEIGEDILNLAELTRRIFQTGDNNLVDIVYNTTSLPPYAKIEVDFSVKGIGVLSSICFRIIKRALFIADEESSNKTIAPHTELVNTMNKKQLKKDIADFQPLGQSFQAV